MTNKNHNSKEIAVEIIGGAATALTYTDREILETLPEEQALEFIELRDKTLAGMNSCKEYESGYNFDESPSLAAEDEITYE